MLAREVNHKWEPCPMSDTGKASGKSFGKELCKVIDESDRSKLRDDIRTLDFGNEGDVSVV